MYNYVKNEESVGEAAVAAHFAVEAGLDADAAHADDDLREAELPGGVHGGVEGGLGAGGEAVEEDLVGVHDALLVHHAAVVRVVPPVRRGIQVERAAAAAAARRLQR